MKKSQAPRWTGRILVAIGFFGAVIPASAGQRAIEASTLIAEAASPAPAASERATPPSNTQPTGLPPGVGAQPPPGAGAGMPDIPGLPGAGAGAPPAMGVGPGAGAGARMGPGAGVGAPPTPQSPGRVGPRPVPPQAASMDQFEQPGGSGPTRTAGTIAAESTNVIAFLDSTTPYVQALDFLLMLAAAVYCLLSLRVRKNLGLTILAISCVISAVILFGFFVYGIAHGRATFPQIAYIIARLLAPFELVLFVIGIFIVASGNRRRP